MKKYTLSLVVILFIGIGFAFAQKTKSFKSIRVQKTSANVVPSKRTCHTMVVDSLLRSKHKSMQSLKQFEKDMAIQVAKYKKSRKTLREATVEDTMYIPVIVHVVHNGQDVGTDENITAAQVYSQLDVLNEDYTKRFGTAGYNTSTVGAGLAIKFVPAAVDTNGRDLDEEGIHRYNGGRSSWNTEDAIENVLKPTTIFNPNKYLNIWTVKFGGDLADILGYAQFPTLSGLDGLDENVGGTTGTAANTDGPVIRYSSFGRTGNVESPYNLGRTTTHELGHFFGLRHIWGDESNCTGTDYCDDTPPTSAAIYNCPANQASCTSGVKAMVANYLDYTNDACMNIFTSDQKTRMMTVLSVSPRRNSLLTSNVYLPTSIPSANFSASVTQTCANTVITFTGSSKKDPTYGDWTFFDANNIVVYTTTGLTQATYAFSAPGIYSVQHIAGNSFGYDTLKINNIITILSDSPQSIPYLEDFESSSAISWTAYNPSADSTWTITDKTSANGIGSKSIFYNNYDTIYSYQGNKTGIISPKFDFSLSDSSAYLTFDLAYAAYNVNYTDTLVLYYSTDCGKTYNSFWKKGGRNLASTTDRDTAFIPNANEWRHEQISLDFLNGYSDVNFLLLNISGWGNNIYLDNINVSIPNRTGVPSSDFIASPRTVCSGSMVSFSDKSTQFPTQWNWTFTEKSGRASSFTSTQQNPNVIFNVSGTYNVSLTASNSLGTGSTVTFTGYVYVSGFPTVNLSASGMRNNAMTISCGKTITLTASGGVSYIWYDYTNGNVIENNNSNTLTVTPTSSTTYVVYGYNAAGCEDYNYVDVTVNGTCTVTSIIYPSTVENNFNIYPNPASDKLTIKALNEDIANYSVKITDLMGKTQLAETVSTATTREFAIQRLPAGVYIINVAGDGFNYYQKLVKE